MGLKDWNADNKQSEMNEKHLHTTTRGHVLTFDGFSWLMMVVLPLLSSPRHKTLTSFFLRPSQDESLSSSPIGQRGPDPLPHPPARLTHQPTDGLTSCCWILPDVLVPHAWGRAGRSCGRSLTPGGAVSPVPGREALAAQPRLCDR